MSLETIIKGEVRYGSNIIVYTIQEKEGLKSHYISVERHSGVVLKGNPVSPQKANKLILKKAKWILGKLKVVNASKEEEIVTGARISYLGRSYYVQVLVDSEVKSVEVDFNESKFKISVNNSGIKQHIIRRALDNFYREKASEKITPRVKMWSGKTKLPYRDLRFMKMKKRWGSCTGRNNLIVNILAIKLPFILIDYLIVHEALPYQD